MPSLLCSKPSLFLMISLICLASRALTQTFPRVRQAYCVESQYIKCHSCKILDLSENSLIELNATCVKCADGYEPRDSVYRFKDTVVHDYSNSCKKEQGYTVWIILGFILACFIGIMIGGLIYGCCKKREQNKKAEEQRKAPYIDSNPNKTNKQEAGSNIREDPSNMPPPATDRPLMTERGVANSQI